MRIFLKEKEISETIKILSEMPEKEELYFKFLEQWFKAKKEKYDNKNSCIKKIYAKSK